MYRASSILIGFGVGLFTAGLIMMIAIIFQPDHPYDGCMLKYTQPEDIIECVWLLENP